jgi:hypothetical protein
MYALFRRRSPSKPKQQSLDRHLRDVLEHQAALDRGETPKKALIINGPIRPRKLMNHGLRYLRSLGPIRHFVRTNGTWFEGRAEVKDFPSAVSWKTKRRPKAGECFKNAREYCLKRPNAKYFEGFYLIIESPDHHAWVVMQDERVLDFTHEAIIRKLKKESAEVHVRLPLYQNDAGHYVAINPSDVSCIFQRAS